MTKAKTLIESEKKIRKKPADLLKCLSDEAKLLINIPPKEFWR